MTGAGFTGLLLAATLLATGGCVSTQRKLNWQGNDALGAGDYKLAADRYQQSLAAAQRAGDEQLAASALYGLGRANGYLCKFPEAEKFFQESIFRREQLADSEDAYLSQNLCELGRLYLAEGKWEDAVAQFERAMPRLERINARVLDPIGYAELLDDYGKALRGAGRPDEAAKISKNAADLRLEFPSRTADYKFQPYPSHCDSP